tara:strand:+ start:10265 stop:11002 length:738 start_codon:yes stop_codon:yes gene_type:complete
MINQLTKQPQEGITYNALFDEFSSASALASIDALTATARGKVTETAALVLSSAVFEGLAVQFKIDGGTDGEEYLITINVTDANGDTWELDAEIRVEDFTWSVPDGVGAPYVVPADYVSRFGYGETVLLTDAHSVGRIDKDLIGNTLLEASAVADGYISKRYQVPLSPIPLTIKIVVADIARYNLHGDNIPDAVETRYKNAMKMLTDVSKGVVTLSTTEVSATNSDAGPEFVSPDRIFNRDTLEGF